jgi:NAD(P)-dependent dehydrogenase (short-subunit alcohol dehydrogenase family)
MNWSDLTLEQDFSLFKAYAQSKMANNLHGRELAKRLEEANISVYMVHPGK